jgi:hypothetical protein
VRYDSGIPDDTQLSYLLTVVNEPGGISTDVTRSTNSDGGFMDTSNYRSGVLKPLADSLGILKLNFQVIRADHRHQGTESGFNEGHPVAPPALASRHHGERVHTGAP